MAAGVVDGALIIDTGLDNKGFIRDAAQFKRAVETLTQAVNKGGQQMGQSMNGYMQALGKAGTAARSAAQGQSALEKEIAKTEAAIARLNERQELARRKFEAAREEAVANATEKVGPYQDPEDYDLPFGHPETVEEWQERVSAAVSKAVEDFGSFEESATFRNLSTEAEFLNEKLANMRAELAANREEGASAGGRVAAAFAGIAQSAGQAASAVAKIAGNAALSFLKKLAAGAKNAAIQLAKLAGRAVVTGLKKIGQLAGGAAKKLFGIGDAAKGGGDGFKHSLKNLMRYGLGIRSLFFLFNKLRNAVKEGFETMAGADEWVAKSLSLLKGALGGLKGSLAAAFAPILTAAAPALTTLINMLTQAVNAVGMFFAAITGQGYYMAAKGMSQVAGAAGKASGSVKELKRQLASFDELNILSKPDTSSGAGGVAAAVENAFTYEKMPISGGIADFAEQIKALVKAENWDGLGQLLAGKINDAFDKARALISWDNLGKKITGVVDGITGTINGLVRGVKWERLGETFGEGVNTVVNTINRFRAGINWEKIGEALANGVNGLIGRVNWENLGAMFRGKIESVLDVLLAAVRTFKWGAMGEAIAEALRGLYDPRMFEKLADLLSGGLNGAVQSLGKVIHKFNWAGVATDFAQSINRFVKGVDWKKLGETLGDGIQTAITMLKNFVTELDWGEIGRSLATGLNSLAGRIKPEEIGLAISNALKGALDFLNNFFETMDWYKLGQDFKKGLEKIDWPGIKESLFRLIKNLFDGLGDFIAGAFLEDLLNKDNLLTKLIELIAPGSVEQTRKIVKAFGGPQKVRELQKEWENGPTTNIEADEVTVSSGSGPIQVTPGNGPIQVTPGNGKTTGSGFFGRAFDGVEKSAQTAAQTVQTTAQTVVEKIRESLIGGDTGAGEEQLTKAPRSFLDEIYNIFTPRAYGDEADLLDPELIKRNQKAVEANTKATKEDTKATDQATDQTTANRQAFARSGGDLNGWDEAFNSGAGSVIANVGVKFTPQGAGGANYENKPLDYLKKVFAPGADTQTRVGLVRQGFSTVAGWVGGYAGGTVNKGIGLVRNGFTTLASWLTGSYMGGAVNKGVGVTRSNFTTLASWLLGSYMGGAVSKGVGVTRSNFTNIASWLSNNYMGGAVSKGIGVVRSGWSLLSSWILGSFMGGGVNKGIGVTRNGWTTVSDWILRGFMGGGVNKGVGVQRSGWTNLASWIIGSFFGGGVNKGVGIERTGWTSVSDWILRGYMGGGVDTEVGLTPGWIGSPTGSIGLDNLYTDVSTGLQQGWRGSPITALNLDNLRTTIKAELQIDQNKKKVVLKSDAHDANTWTLETKALGGIITAGGRSLSFAAGGMIRGGAAKWWSRVPHYASGTSRAHGTMFLAGEAGPEILGHVNGRTEILNKSQLAQTMRSAVMSGMVAALRGITFTVPVMASGGVMPYDVAAQIAQSTANLQGTLDANNEDLIQTIISVAGQIVAAIQRGGSGQGAAPQGGGLTAQSVIDEINRRTLMYGASPLKGV